MPSVWAGVVVNRRVDYELDGWLAALSSAPAALATCFWPGRTASRGTGCGMPRRSTSISMRPCTQRERARDGRRPRRVGDGQALPRTTRLSARAAGSARSPQTDRSPSWTHPASARSSTAPSTWTEPRDSRTPPCSMTLSVLPRLVHRRAALVWKMLKTELFANYDVAFGQVLHGGLDALVSRLRRARSASQSEAQPGGRRRKPKVGRKGGRKRNRLGEFLWYNSCPAPGKSCMGQACTPASPPDTAPSSFTCRPRACDKGVSAFFWAFGFFLYIWIGQLDAASARAARSSSPRSRAADLPLHPPASARAARRADRR